MIVPSSVRTDTGLRGSSSQPRIHVTISNGWAIRNYLHSGLIERLTSIGDVTIFTTEQLRQYVEEFCKEKEFLFSTDLLPEPESRFWIIFRKMRKVAFQIAISSETARIKLCGLTRRRFLRFLINKAWRFGALPGDFFFRLTSGFESTCKRASRPQRSPYRADVALVGFPFSGREIEFQWWCRNSGIDTVTVIPSWDNLSSKGVLPANGGSYLVWGRAQKRELVHYYHRFLMAEDVFIVGLPQFDPYLKRVSVRKDAILFATGSPSLCPHEPELVRRLAKRIAEGGFGPDVRLIVRLHPVDDPNRYSGLEAIGATEIQRPSNETGAGVEKWIPDPRECVALSETLQSSLVCINTASTITLDALACEVPVINIGFDEEPDFHRSCRRFYDHDHYRGITQIAGVELVSTEEALYTAIRDAIVGRFEAVDSMALADICDVDGVTSVDKYARAIQGVLFRRDSGRRVG